MLIFIFHFLGSLDKTFPLSDVKYCSCLLNLFPFLLFIPFPPFYSPSMDLAEIKYSLLGDDAVTMGGAKYAFDKFFTRKKIF